MGSEKHQTKTTTSGAPPEIVKEREMFVRTVLRKGVEFTEELIRENKRYGQEIAKLQTENARLRAQIASEDAIRELLGTIEILEKERSDLLARSRELERTSVKYEDRYLQMEKELNDLASLYVASFQLHATLFPRHVLEHIGDLLDQFVGAKTSVLYIIQPDRRTAEPVAWTKMDESILKPVRLGEGVVGEVCLTGVLMIRHEILSGGNIDNPLAVVPLTAEGQTLGAISVLELLQQKQKWEDVDEELFKLLGAHACTALIASNLFDNGRKDPLIALQGIRAKLPQNCTGFGRESAVDIVR